jgi:hypothetical protein
VTRALLAALLVAPVACATAGHKPVFYTATAQYHLALDLSGVQHVVVRSSLPQEKLTVMHSTAAGSVSGVMEYAIGGYHGTRKDAGVGPVPPAAMVFDEEHAGATLTLKSREWMYIHHSMLYTRINISVPKDVDVIAQPYSHEELVEHGSK